MNIAAAAASHIAKDLVSIHNIAIHAPGSSHPSLSDGTFNYDWFMGKWGVAWSTLPMWKVSVNKKFSADLNRIKKVRQ